MLLGVVEHGGADATLEVGAGQDIVVDAGLTTAPESGIVGKLLEGDRTVTQLVVDLEDSRSRGDAEEFGVGEKLAAIDKRETLDAFGQSATTELGFDNQAGIDHEGLVAPTLNVAEAGELIAAQSDDGLALQHLLRDIIGRTTCDTCAARLAGFLDHVEDFLNVMDVLLTSYINAYIGLVFRRIVHFEMH